MEKDMEMERAATMRAAIHDAYGGPSVLGVADIARPTVGTTDVLVRVVASTVNRSDCGYRSGKPFIVRYFSGVRRPKRRVLGSEFAGEVVAVGSGVTSFAVGDRVFGVNAVELGANAEYLCMDERLPIAPMPPTLTFDEAASICDGMVLALTCLRRADLQRGERVVVYGASGAIGTAAVQLAKHFGVHVTAVCSTRDVDIVSSLGADEVIDYTVNDFTTNGETYDVIFDAVGKHSYLTCRRSLRPGGRFLETDLGFLWQNPFWAVVTRWFGSTRLLFPIPKYTKADVEFVSELIAGGEYRPVIDRRYPLDQIVEATTYVETGQKTGNVVITVADAVDPGPTSPDVI